MAQKFDITITSTPSYGYTLTRTSYDIHQEINAKVIGVLKYNNDIRKKLLERNIGAYNQLNFEGIGYISNLYSNLSSKPFSFDKNGLLGYTHISEPGSLGNGNSFTENFSNLINSKYDFNDIKYYYTGLYPESKSLNWNGKYKDYSEYASQIFEISLNPFVFLSEIFKNDKLSNPLKEDLSTIQSVLNDFLQYDNIKYAMEKNRIGTVTPNPLLALLGAVTTNVSNFNGKDTALGIITNQVYANTLHKGAVFNSLRRTQYITPEVYDIIGNKLSTIATIASDFRIDENTGRLAYDLGDNAQTISYETLDSNDYFNSFGDVGVLVYSDTNNNDIFRYKQLLHNYSSRYNDFFEKHIYPYSPFKDEEYIKRTIIIKTPSTWNDKESDDEDYSNSVNSGLIKLTEILFKKGKINSLINRYYDNKNIALSRGRSLLKKDPNTKNIDRRGYENPYCRVWTYYNKYNNIKNLIRPFSDDDGIKSVGDIQNTLNNHIRRENGIANLENNTVLNKNGFINITPTDRNKEIKKYMFSIENLAWKDFDSNLSEEQQGPNGGRIMWFPPYGLDFQENVNVNWGQNEFIGRGEKIYTYTNTERSGTLSFILLVDNPSIVSEWKKIGIKEETDNEQEQQLLRFFAGCEPLELNENKTIEITSLKNNVQYTNEIGYEYVAPEVTEGKIVFYIFFPNNYSGKDDDFDNALNYLINDYDNGDYSSEGLIPIYEGYDWCYRVDREYREGNQQSLKGATGNYKDLKSYYLNQNKNSILIDNYKDITHSFKDIYENYINILGIKIIKEAHIEGGATNVGYKNSNEILCENRMKFAEKFLTNKLGIEEDKITKNEKPNLIELDTSAISNVSSKESKLSRYAKITLITHELVEKPLTFTVDNLFNNLPSEVKKNIYNINYISNYIDKSKNIDIKERNKYIESFYKEKKIQRSKRVTEDVATTYTVTKIPNKVHRSDDEYRYFEYMSENQEFLDTKIISKIKYFNPAFHSITPEGFNSRLSFLHQCTRQGPTISTSEYSEEINNMEMKNTGNLSFGRPPVCILRVGDFYNTKVIITSMSIDFNDTTWDMNPEGIGVQPMFARISLNITFLGGSDLGAPISRLQNAISFNYYANQSIYDDRSDMGEYDGKNPKIKGIPWVPNNNIT